MNENKETISEYCWAGRATGTVIYLIKKYAYLLNSEDVKIVENENNPLKLATCFASILRERIPQQDSRIVDSLIEKSGLVLELDSSQLSEKDVAEYEYGMEEVEYILRKDENLEVILQERAFVNKKIFKFRKRINVLRIIFIPIFLIFLFVILILIYEKINDMPYFVERSVYEKIENEKDRYNLLQICEYYIKEFPDGANIVKVKEIYEKTEKELDNEDAELILFRGLGAWKNPECLGSLVETYRQRHPNGKYLEDINIYYDTLWTNAITHYSKLNSEYIDAKAHNAIVNMLQYMKDNYIDTISVNTEIDISELKQISDTCYDAVVREDLKTTYPQGILVSIKKTISSHYYGYDIQWKMIEKMDSCMYNKMNRSDNWRLYRMISRTNRAHDNILLEKCPQFAINVKITNKEFKKNGTLYPQFFVIEGEYQKIIYDINYDVTITLQMPNEEPCCIYKNKVSIADLENPKEIKSTEDMLKRLEDLSVNGFLKEIGL